MYFSPYKLDGVALSVFRECQNLAAAPDSIVKGRMLLLRIRLVLRGGRALVGGHDVVHYRLKIFLIDKFKNITAMVNVRAILAIGMGRMRIDSEAIRVRSIYQSVIESPSFRRCCRLNFEFRWDSSRKSLSAEIVQCAVTTGRPFACHILNMIRTLPQPWRGA